MMFRCAEAPDADVTTEGRTMTPEEVCLLLGIDLQATVIRSAGANELISAGYIFEIIHDERRTSN